MNKNIKTILYIAGFIVMMIIAISLYNFLNNNYTNNDAENLKVEVEKETELEEKIEDLNKDILLEYEEKTRDVSDGNEKEKTTESQKQNQGQTEIIKSQNNNENETKESNNKEIEIQLENKLEVDQDNIKQVEKTYEKAEDFYVINNNNEKVYLSSFFGKPIVINFWTTWCSPCKMELPEFNEAYQKYSNEIDFLMINLTDGFSETKEGVNKFILDNNYDFPVFYDLEFNASNTYNIFSIPQTYFINENGEVVSSYIGLINKNVLEENINKILNK